MVKEFWARGKVVGLFGVLAGASVWLRMASSSAGQGPRNLGEYALGLSLSVVAFGVLGLLYANLFKDIQLYVCSRGRAGRRVADVRVEKLTTAYLCGSVSGAALIIWSSTVEFVVLAGAFILAWGPISSIYVAGKDCDRLRLAKGLGWLGLVLSLGIAALALCQLHSLGRL